MGLLAPFGKSLRRRSPLDYRKRHCPARWGLLRRLRLETLEGRCLLTILTVNSPLDTTLTPTGTFTLRELVNQAGPGDTIEFAPSLNGATISLQLGPLPVSGSANLTVDAPSSGVTINGDGQNIFQVAAGGALSLSWLTLTGGGALNGDDGGAINNAGRLTLQDCTFTANSATANSDGGGGWGGAVYNTGTLVTSGYNFFNNNSASCGGAVANGSGGTASLEYDSYSSGNSAAQQGGAIYNAGAMTVYGCTLSGNTAVLGGGLFNSGVFIRVHDPNNDVGTGMEVQILDNTDYGVPFNAGNANGALYDLVRPAVDANKPIGEWNHFRITVNQSLVVVELNGKEIVRADLSQWVKAGKNPGGGHNKFPHAIGELPREGFICLQNYGATPVWFRNVRLKSLSDRKPQYTGKEPIGKVLQNASAAEK